MRAVVQRVSRASVNIDEKEYSRIGQGLLILLGIGLSDTEEDVNWLVKKTAALRIFNDDEGVMNRSVKEIGGEVMVVSQFTLLASYKKGNRPSYIYAAKPDVSIPLYEDFCRKMSDEMGRKIAHGVFGADMKLDFINDGPVTICMDTKNKE